MADVILVWEKNYIHHNLMYLMDFAWMYLQVDVVSISS